MSFEPIEESRALGEPIYLYLFRYGVAPDAYYAYTDADQPITVGSYTYTPIPIDVDAITASGTLDKSSITIRTPRTTGLAELFRVYPPSQVVTGTIFQGHANDPLLDFKAIWTGRIISCNREQFEAQFTCEPVSTSLRRNGLRRHYQYGCPHVLYGNGCRANKANATINTTAGNINGTTIALPTGWNGAIDPIKFVGGLVEFTGANGSQTRTILSANSGAVQVAGVPLGLVPGNNVAVVLGCNHQMNDCTALHNNILNYGGQPWIPTKNPVSNVSQY